jgi:phosphoribosyl 1,2-cyclic phosphodiesterase
LLLQFIIGIYYLYFIIDNSIKSTPKSQRHSNSINPRKKTHIIDVINYLYGYVRKVRLFSLFFPSLFHLIFNHSQIKPHNISLEINSKKFHKQFYISALHSKQHISDILMCLCILYLILYILSSLVHILFVRKRNNESRRRSHDLALFVSGWRREFGVTYM